MACLSLDKSAKRPASVCDRYRTAKDLQSLKDEVLGPQLQVELWDGVSGVTSDNSVKGNGGDDETRTRDLCRDRAR
jgi:hypothetical protein